MDTAELIALTLTLKKDYNVHPWVPSGMNKYVWYCEKDEGKRILSENDGYLLACTMLKLSLSEPPTFYLFKAIRIEKTHSYYIVFDKLTLED